MASCIYAYIYASPPSHSKAKKPVSICTSACIYSPAHTYIYAPPLNLPASHTESREMNINIHDVSMIGFILLHVDCPSPDTRCADPQQAQHTERELNMNKGAKTPGQSH
jgi:hypothetical protein